LPSSMTACASAGTTFKPHCWASTSLTGAFPRR
jgi:hypothetical protein